ncbi:unnamed protein product (mitochondrion) [Plasmodiophora brassicae]|uniref:PI3K/PI4K catalytic domain-containing protein n=1 Tax=Plasmodiophora brassicae TaxID=37360 RepID=A0A0G4IVX9_PLABS|nr:hypothetical protein PBRA_001190 [Plasmodiophora brassicae]SPQ97300.1 unnamed protein product [Plasmodiophora brassicae]
MTWHCWTALAVLVVFAAGVGGMKGRKRPPALLTVQTPTGVPQSQLLRAVTFESQRSDDRVTEIEHRSRTSPVSPSCYNHTFVASPLPGTRSSTAYILAHADDIERRPAFVLKKAGAEYNDLKRGIRAGDTVLKEKLAYDLDKDHWAGVPETTLCTVHVVVDECSCPTPIFGSVQKFVTAASPFASPLLSFHYKVESVHRIGLLDIRLMNLDRHPGNLLASADGALTPIDHGFVLPVWYQLADVELCWTSWPQAQVPFSTATRTYMTSLRPMDDVTDMAVQGLAFDSIITYLLGSTLIQTVLNAGDAIVLQDLGEYLRRPDPDTHSQLEVAIADAAGNMADADDTFRSCTTIDDATCRQQLDLLLSNFRDRVIVDFQMAGAEPEFVRVH